jgi:MGT family glycosyltransferase
VDLMNRLLGILADSPYRVIVSKGPQADLIELGPNMWGEEFVPQTRILPHVDVVITHGGNNTVTECLHFGIPMVVLPLFWDQYDNAQRMHELDVGVRLDTYRSTRDDLIGAIDMLLTGHDRRGRLADISRAVRSSRGTEAAADLIERIATAPES